MKNSKEYSQKVHRLYRSLKRKYPKPQKAIYDEPVDALIYAIVSENMSQTAAQSALKRFTDTFVDWNDLRVSSVEEIIEALGADTPVTRDTASALVAALRAVFCEYNKVGLEVLKKIGKRPAKQALEEMDGTSRFVVNYCMLTSLNGHAVPLTKKMIEYLRNNQLVHPDADEQEIEGFLARQVSSDSAYEFYTLLRRQSESRSGRQKKETATNAKIKAATKSKKKTKKVKRKE
jgi:endonuclease III